MKKRRGIKKEHQEERGALTPTIVWGLVVLVFLVGVMFVAYQTKRSLRPPEYEGKIIDKWAGYSHSELGSFPYFRVLVETDGGQRMTVAIDRDNYERAKVGMRIKKTPKGIELARVAPTHASASTLAMITNREPTGRRPPRS